MADRLPEGEYSHRADDGSFSGSSFHRLNIEIRDDSIRRVTIDPELGKRAFSVAPLDDLAESGLAKRELQGFKIIDKGTGMTVEKPIDPFSPTRRSGAGHFPKSWIVSGIGLGDFLAIVDDHAKRPARLEQSMEFPKYRRPRLDGEAVENVIRKNRRARPGIKRQGASKIAPQIHRTSLPAVHIDPAWHDTIAAAEIEQEPPSPPVGAGAPSPSRMEAASNTNGPEKPLPADLPHQLHRNRRPLDTPTNCLSDAHRTSERPGRKKG